MAGEGNIVGDVGLRVNVVDPGLEAQIKRLIDRIERNASVKVGADTAPAEKAVQGLTQQVDHLGESWGEAALGVAGFTAAVYAVKNAVEQAIGKLSGLFDQLAQARAGFNSILNSDIAGGKLLNDIREFARVSPFVTGELVNYSQQLLGVGLTAEKIIPLLTSTGDIISSVGGDTANLGRVLFTLTQIKSIGSLKGQDTLQLQNSLIPITKYLSEYLKKSTAEIVKLRENGQITADQVFEALNAQGEKVKGAMGRATRNITGAEAVLSDTIKILLQNQPVLSNIFTDTYKGILKFSDFLSKPEVTQAITNFFTELERVYTALKPLGSTLAEFGSSGGLLALRTFTDLLTILSNVLESIPEPVLELMVKAFVTMSALKAPLALITYVTRIQQIATGAIGAVTGLRGTAAGIGATGDAAAVAEQKLGRYNAAIAKLNPGGKLAKFNKSIPGGGASVGLGLALAGGEISDGQGGARDAVGQIGTYAGLGATLGGPAGAVAGGVFGMVTALISANKKAKEIAKQAGIDSAKAYADGFIKESLASHAGEANVGKSFLDDVFKEAASYSAPLNAYEKLLNTNNQKLKDLLEELGNTGSQPGVGDALATQIEHTRKVIDNATVSIARYKQERETLLKSEDVQGPLIGVAAKLAKITGDQGDSFLGGATQIGGPQGHTQTYAELAILTGQEIPQTVEQYDALNARLTQLGINMQFVQENSAEAIETLIKTRQALPEAFKDAATAASKFVEVAKAAKTAATEVFKPFTEEASLAGNTLAQIAELNTRFSSLLEAGKNGGADTLRQGIGAADVNAIGQQILARAVLTQQIATGRGASETEALNQGLQIEVGLFDTLQKTLGVTDVQFTKYLKDTGLYNAYVAAQSQAGNTQVGTLTELASKYGIAADKLAEMLGITKELGKFAEITFSQEAQTALTRYVELQKAARDENGLGRYEISQEMQRIIDIFPELAAVVDPAIAKAKEAADAVWGPFLRMAHEYIDAVDTANTLNSSFGSLYNLTADNAVALTGNIDDTAKVARDILDRATGVYDTVFAKTKSETEATNAALSTTFQQFELLQNVLGLTDEAFKSLLDSLGLVEPAGTAITGTFTEVAKQMGVTEQALAKIVGYIGDINPNVVITVTLDAQKAQEELDRLDRSGRPGDVAHAKGLQARVDAGTTYTDPSKPQAKDDSAEKAKKYADAVQSALDALTNKVQAAADAIAEAADRWVSSIKERTQYEQAVSVGTATRNTRREIKDLTDLAAGLVELRARGLSDEAIKSLGIDNVADVKQVKKLLKANPGDLVGLSQSVRELNSKATAIATTEEDKRTRTNITQAIIDAAKSPELGLTIDKPGAQSIAATFAITPESNAEEIANAILFALSGGKIGS